MRGEPPKPTPSGEPPTSSPSGPPGGDRDDETAALAVRLILDRPRDAAWNMAIDEALLDRASRSNAREVWIRRADWSSPAATLGRFQAYREFEIAGARRPSVRRITGGGAILHYRECTISAIFAVPLRPSSDPALEHGGDSPGRWARVDRFARTSPLDLATAAATVWESALARWAPDLSRRGGESDERTQSSIPDCFERTSPFDLVRPGASGLRKVGGLALARRSGTLLVQSSIRRVPVGLEPEDDPRLLVELAGAMGLEAAPPTALPDSIERMAEEWVRRRYGSERWNRRCHSSSEATS